MKSTTRVGDEKKAARRAVAALQESAAACLEAAHDLAFYAGLTDREEYRLARDAEGYRADARALRRRIRTARPRPALVPEFFGRVRYVSPDGSASLLLPLVAGSADILHAQLHLVEARGWRVEPVREPPPSLGSRFTVRVVRKAA